MFEEYSVLDLFKSKRNLFEHLENVFTELPMLLYITTNLHPTRLNLYHQHSFAGIQNLGILMGTK
jgi:hypothetical protein